MFKFFRNIRRKLLDDNQIGKYLKYAFGEVVLVVIGILIALYLNNLREQRANDLKYKRMFSAVREELAYNIHSIDSVFRDRVCYDSAMRDVIFTDKIYDDFSDNYELKFQAQLYQRVAWPRRDSYESVLRNIEDMPSQYDPIMKNLKDLDNVFSNIRASENEMEKDYFESDKVLSNDLPWYSELISALPPREKIIKSMSENPSFKNTIARKYRLKTFHTQACFTYRTKAANLINSIDQKIDSQKSTNSTELDQFDDILGVWFYSNQPGNQQKKRDSIGSNIQSREKCTIYTRNQKLLMKCSESESEVEVLYIPKKAVLTATGIFWHLKVSSDETDTLLYPEIFNDPGYYRKTIGKEN